MGPPSAELVAADIEAAVRAGAGGVVIGALTPAGEADHAAVARWRSAAGAATLVFHRAIDATPGTTVSSGHQLLTIS